MSEQFKADKIAQERPDPVEGISTRWIGVPLSLLMVYLVWGASYLVIQTESFQFRNGDMRSPTTAVEDTSTPSTESPIAGGEMVFKRNCQACHQAQGQGLDGAFPPLAGSEWVNGPSKRMAAIVLFGLSGKVQVKDKTYQGTMPSFRGKLSHEELAAVLTFVRASWGNSSQPVDASMIEDVERDFDREVPWKGQAELDSNSWQ